MRDQWNTEAVNQHESGEHVLLWGSFFEVKSEIGPDTAVGLDNETNTIREIQKRKDGPKNDLTSSEVPFLVDH